MDYIFKDTLDTSKIKGNNFFQPIIDEEMDDDKTISEKKKYVDSCVSGTVYENSRCASSGSKVVSFDKFVSMVKEGYNIVKAELINDRMVSVEFQELYDVEKKMGGR